MLSRRARVSHDGEINFTMTGLLDQGDCKCINGGYEELKATPLVFESDGLSFLRAGKTHPYLPNETSLSCVAT